MSPGRILVVNGPNLNLLGRREPDLYGGRTHADLAAELEAAAGRLGCEVSLYQSNSEGELVDHLQRHAPGARGVVFNPGALTHYSYALYDCLRSLSTPVVEVHLTNIHARPEAFRRQTVTGAAATGLISGLGFRGYLLAMEFLLGND